MRNRPRIKLDKEKTMQQADYDVVIVGSGTVGATLASALLRGGLSVALVEKTPATPIDTEILDLRVFALTRASERIFTHLGLWSAITQRRASPFRQMYVWDTNSHIHFDSASLVEPLLGYIVEHSILQTVLLEHLATCDALTWYRPAKVQRFDLPARSSPEKAIIYLDDGRRLTTRLLVSAEGAHASIRTLAGIPYTSHNYGQQAIVTNVLTEFKHQETAWQRFLPTGPLAFLPLLDPHQCSIVWSVNTPVAQRLMRLTTAEFLQALTSAFAEKLGTVHDCGQRVSYPLQRRYAHRYVQSRLALVGDAAHTVHPLAGQGVNLGLLDVAALSEVVLTAHRERQDFGQYPILRHYERARKGHNLGMVLLMDGFNYLFSNNFLPLLQLRTLGLTLTNNNHFLKNIMMQKAMGLSEDFPTLFGTRPV